MFSKRVMFSLMLGFTTSSAYSSDGYQDLGTVGKAPSFLNLKTHFPKGKLNLNPGFYTKKSFVTTNKLQSCIDESFVSLKKKFGKTFGVTLVDLSGDKLHKPHFAQYNSYRSMYGASQPKIASLLAAHQMLRDVKGFAKELTLSGVSDLSTLKSSIRNKLAANNSFKLEDKFYFKKKGGGIDIGFTSEFKKDLDKMIRLSDNVKASLVIKKLGFNYINSVLWQSGLYDKSRGGGIWLGRAYGKPPGVARWRRSPMGNYSHGTNAISMAKLLTLMTQDRLIDPSYSKSFKSYLANTIFPIKFILSFKNMGLKVNQDGKNVVDPTKKVTVFRKSGSMGPPIPVSHDAALVYRTVCANKGCSEKIELRYVATASSKDSATKSMWIFGQKLDSCILRNNGVLELSAASPSKNKI